jgi:hypothetical protein
MLRQRQQSAWLNEQPRRACPLRRTPESRAAWSRQAGTRRSLEAQLLVVVSLAADALRRRQFVLRAPGEQPRLHVLRLDVVARLDLAVGLPHLSQHPFLIGNVRFDSIRNQEIRAAAGSLCQPGQTPFDLRFQADAEGSTARVRHEHIVTRDRECYEVGCPILTERSLRVRVGIF